MMFNDYKFWLVFPLIFIVYWIVPGKWAAVKKWFLIAASYLLYMNFKPAYALILLGVTLITYAAARAFESSEKLIGGGTKEGFPSLQAL